jgi:hypothetical protein
MRQNFEDNRTTRKLYLVGLYSSRGNIVINGSYGQNFAGLGRARFEHGTLSASARRFQKLKHQPSEGRRLLRIGEELHLLVFVRGTAVENGVVHGFREIAE